MITRGDWGSYARELPKEKHRTGKIFTQHIERNNLTLRTLNVSRAVEIREKVIGAFIEKQMFYSLATSPNTAE